jgi:hypothetical protein
LVVEQSHLLVATLFTHLLLAGLYRHFHLLSIWLSLVAVAVVEMRHQVQTTLAVEVVAVDI